jgi:acyl-CoA thioesterase YciA
MSSNDTRIPALRTIAMPRDTNPNGDIFGGWLISQMDLAGAAVAFERAGGPVVTVGIEAMKFHRPVLVGDQVTCYAEIIKIGRTSIQVMIDTWVKRLKLHEDVKVTEGIFTYVAIDDNHQKKEVVR